MSSSPFSGNQLRHVILDQSKRAHVGHIGSCLSIADIVATLYNGVLRISQPANPERDRFILSKGHAALCLYAALHLRGWMSQEELDTFCTSNTRLGTHPEYIVPGIECSTGSLGFGLSYGVGAALAARLQKSDRRVYVLLSDAECNEGSTWEAVMSAAHYGLSQLTAIVDCNGQQALGYTREVLNLSPLAERWKAFGWDVREEDGHDVSALTQALQRPPLKTPRVIIARTTFGKGVSFMENQIPWHYWPMSDDHYAQAKKELAGS